MPESRLASGLQIVTMHPLLVHRLPLTRGLMHCYPALLRIVRSSLVIALLPLALMGCSNAPAGAKQTPGEVTDSGPPP